ncbi:MAG: hypothetical protein U1E63_10420 [Burkholderiales bacterium]
MEANERGRACLVLLILSFLFAAVSAHAAERCGTSSTQFEGLAGQLKSVDAAAALPPAADARGTSWVAGDQAFEGYLALHCEALSKLLLGPAVRSYDGCANSSALR